MLLDAGLRQMLCGQKTAFQVKCYRWRGRECRGWKPLW